MKRVDSFRDSENEGGKSHVYSAKDAFCVAFVARKDKEDGVGAIIYYLMRDRNKPRYFYICCSSHVATDENPENSYLASYMGRELSASDVAGAALQFNNITGGYDLEYVQAAYSLASELDAKQPKRRS